MMRRTILDCMTLVGATPSRFDGEKAYISTGAVDCDHIDYSQAESVTYESRPSRANLSVTEGDILFAKMCGTKKTLRISKTMADHLYSTGFCAVRANESVMTPELLYHLLASEQFLSQKDQNSSGATQKAITNAGLKKITVNVPSLDEQHKLAAKLDCIEDMIAKRYEQLIYLDQLVKSRFIELFGDPDKNPMNWETAELAHHLEIVGGFAFKSEGFADFGIPVLRIGNINSGHFLPVNMVFWPEDSTLERYKVHPGDLVMSLTGTVGKDDYGNVCILGNEYPEYYLNQRNAKLAIKATLNKRYLSEMLKFSKIKKRLTGISRGVRQANISNRDILALCVPIPPIALQEQFATFVEQTDKSKLAVQQGLQELEILKKSLMQQYFG